MREADWLTAKDPQPMLDYLRAQASDRKLRLFAAACCREVWGLLDARGRSALEVVERYADGGATRLEIAEARREALAAERTTRQAARAVYWATKEKIGESVQTVCDAALGEAVTAAVQQAHTAGRDLEEAWEKNSAATAARQADLLRDCFGNPFRPAALDPAWLAWGGGTVTRLAQAAYEGRAFDRLPVLADALEEAGCADPAILGHCRSGGQHVRGCWLVDLVLAKG